MTKKAELMVTQDFGYLADLPKVEMPDIGGLTFHKVTLGGSNDRTDEATGTLVESKKFNAQGFPGFNYDNMFVIPLLVLGKRRVLYLGQYTGQSRPPTCFSSDGVRADVPTVVDGVELAYCQTCPHYPFEAKTCKPRPGIYGVALFPDGVAVPVFLDVSVTSRKAVQSLLASFPRPVKVGETLRVLPHYTRVMKVGRKPGDLAMEWTFQLLTPDTVPEGIPPFTPPDMLQSVPELVNAAKIHLESLRGSATQRQHAALEAKAPAADTSNAVDLDESDFQ